MVAEGVETESQASYLVAHHVKFAQGWLFSPALPAEEFIEFYYRTNARTENVRAIYQGAA
jgi:sensor c-di-GMP phosphodiesterase-like protein